MNLNKELIKMKALVVSGGLPQITLINELKKYGIEVILLFLISMLSKILQ